MAPFGYMWPSALNMKSLRRLVYQLFLLNQVFIYFLFKLWPLEPFRRSMNRYVQSFLKYAAIIKLPMMSKVSL